MSSNDARTFAFASKVTDWSLTATDAALDATLKRTNKQLHFLEVANGPATKLFFALKRIQRALKAEQHARKLDAFVLEMLDADPEAYFARVFAR
jgi:hypothetical protein